MAISAPRCRKARRWSAAWLPSWTTWKGSKQTWACGSPSGARIAFSYPADMSIETASIEAFCSSVSPSKKVTRVAHAAARPLDRLGQITAARAVQPAQPTFDHAPHAAEIEMAPALDAMILDLQTAGSAARADRPPATQTDRHDHGPLAELHIPHPGTWQPEHPIECRRDPHVALLGRQLNSEHSAACRNRVAAGRPTCARLASRLSRVAIHTPVAKPRATRQAALPVSDPLRRPKGFTGDSAA